MLIKIQHHRMSRDWAIFENARYVKYSDNPVGFDTLESYKEYEMTFIKSRPGANDFVFKDAENKIVWNPGSSYFVNELSFLNEDGYLVNLIFDGEAYICNNEGKTIPEFTRVALFDVNRCQKQLRLECRGRGICPC